MNDSSVTIVAVATPPGRGGVGCVRISGPEAERVAGRMFRPAAERSWRAGARPTFGRFLARDGTPIDHGYLVVFAATTSFTGEPTAELWAHGSPAVLAELVDAAIGAGSRPAGPGEFTYRALRNGRLDLVRAEAVRDLVAARTLFQARTAFAQVEGALSRKLAPLREELADLIARTEAAVEFVDEAGTHLEPGDLKSALKRLEVSCGEMLAGFRRGRIVREGATVAITGLPNVGKSSLFNRLLERDRAIVTAIPGTTRDTLEEALDLGGVLVRLVDTAGLREVGDPVEAEGVLRARRAREESDLVLFVLDASRALDPIEEGAIRDRTNAAGSERTIVVVNKSDLRQGPAPHAQPLGALEVSARTGEGIDVLRARLRRTLLGSGSVEDPILTNARHAAALEEASAAIRRGREASRAGLTEEIVLEELREAMTHLGSVTGEFSTSDLLDRIFSTFCIGK